MSISLKKRRRKELIKKIPNIAEKWNEEQRRIKAGSKYFRSFNAFRFQSWKVDGRRTSSDLNLYKISLERFTQLAKDNALFSILVQDDFAIGNGSAGVRHLVIDHYELKEFLSFENRKGIFASVDSRYNFAVLDFEGGKARNKSTGFYAFFYKHSLDDLNNNNLKLFYSFKVLFEMEPERYAMSEAQNKEMFELFKKVGLTFEPLRITEKIDFGNDFHKTNDSDKFIDIKKATAEDIPLYEGKYINQFVIKPDEIKYVIPRDFVEQKVKKNLNVYRIALRAVARATDKRSLIATLLPPNTSSVHSLFSERNADQISIKEKLFILGYDANTHFGLLQIH